MISHLNPSRFYTNRSYLTQWIDQDVLVVTDNDFENTDEAVRLINQSTDKKIIVDITHNPWHDSRLPVDIDPTLTGNFDYFYTLQPGRVFFPVFVWMFSLRSNLWFSSYDFDAHNKKTKGAMCLNNHTRDHRTQLYNLLEPVRDRMVYTVNNQGLPGEPPNQHRVDVSVSHPVYSECCVNIVTETVVHLPWLSEKTCKPFVARQIPIIVGAAGVNRFLEDVGLDMFSDIVPWKSWDSESDNTLRVEKIAEFVKQWIQQDSMLSTYRRVLDRVEKNKKHFHSEKFRNIIMNQMDSYFKPA
jgi:hypothetical protein